MISKHTKIIITFIVVVFAILTVLFAFNLYYNHGIQYPKGFTDFNDTGDYEINPNTILSDLDQGKTDVFKPIIASHVAFNTPFPYDTFSWSQSDYLRVASALHQFVWNETLDDWYVYGMTFRRGCQDIPVGFGSADITYYKYNNQRGVYTVHEMNIYPDGGGVSWGGGDGFSRPLFGWESINLSRLKVTADDALKIAEENGGKEYRAKIKNTCGIHLILKPNPDNNNWAVYYNAESSSSGFEIAIDPYTSWH